jgi:serine/threonine-protein kinase
VAFVGCKEAACLLYVRGRRELDAQPIADTDGATCPFFSPDGRFIGFGANGKLKKVPAAGGPLVTLAEAPQLRGGSWGPDGTILFTGSQGGLMRVAADGGEAHRVTQLDPVRDSSHRWPQFLPGGRAARLDVTRRSGIHDVAVADLSTGAVRILVEDADYPRYAPSGDLLFGRLGTVYAAPFDLDRLTLNGRPAPVLEGVVMSQHPAWNIESGVAYYDVAQDGTLLYSPLDAVLPKRTLVWVNRAGRVASASSSQRSFANPILSRDGRRLAVEIGWEIGSHDVFVADLERDAWTRITADGRSEGGAWLPGADRLIVDTAEADHHSMRLVGVDGSTRPDNLFTTLFGGQATVAPDGHSILVAHEVAPAQWDISRLPLEGDRVAEPWLATPASEFCASVSSDGRYVAYRSDASGRAEVYVRPYSGSGQQHQVSTQGGNSPLWSRDGREIFFASRGGLWSARVRTSPTFAAEIPRRLFDVPDDILVDNFAFYDVSPDGQKFLMVREDPYELRPIELVLVPSWTEEVKGRLRAGGAAPH